MKNLFRTISLVVLCLTLTSAESFAASRPLALVWRGPGACKPGCAGAAATVARQAGFRTRFVYPGFNDESAFQEAKLWVQPGGKSTTAAAAMGPILLARIAEFVKQGGGYVGFCAGGFISTAEIGTSHQTGFGIIPGATEVLVTDGNDHQMMKLSTVTGDRWMYYAGGPFFKVSDADLKAANGEILARYADGRVAGIRAHYGKGKVAVIGTHPEAGFVWKMSHFKFDQDGSDRRFVVDEMIRYATSQNE